MRLPVLLAGLLVGCAPDVTGSGGDDSAADSGESDHTGAAEETGDTAEPEDSSEPGDTADTGETSTPTESGSTLVDADGDGVDSTLDCDDSDATNTPTYKITGYNILATQAEVDSFCSPGCARLTGMLRVRESSAGAITHLDALRCIALASLAGLRALQSVGLDLETTAAS